MTQQRVKTILSSALILGVLPALALTACGEYPGVPRQSQQFVQLVQPSQQRGAANPASAPRTMEVEAAGETLAQMGHEPEDVLTEAHALERKPMGQLHLELALSAMEAREIEDCRHHVKHFVEAAGGADKLKGQQILKLINERNLYEARHGIERLLGMTPHSE